MFQLFISYDIFWKIGECYTIGTGFRFQCSRKPVSGLSPFQSRIFSKKSSRHVRSKLFGSFQFIFFLGKSFSSFRNAHTSFMLINYLPWSTGRETFGTLAYLPNIWKENVLKTMRVFQGDEKVPVKCSSLRYNKF